MVPTEERRTAYAECERTFAELRATETIEFSASDPVRTSPTRHEQRADECVQLWIAAHDDQDDEQRDERGGDTRGDLGQAGRDRGHRGPPARGPPERER